MANSKIVITNFGGTDLNEYISIEVNGVVLIETWKTVRTTNFEATIGSTITNFITAFNLDYNTTGSFIVAQTNSSEVTITSTSPTVNFTNFISIFAYK